ncbi:MAG TPA: hypothetical protein VHI78_06885 [Bacteroidales bacterium]|jgi:hypothetical protein|nr:hypothetical protein [Bacteroidales bacterium]
MKLIERIRLILRIASYNLKIVFSGKFVYFLIAAWLFFLTIDGIMLFEDNNIDVSDIYDLLLFPGILILFYPVVYNIQNDKDTRMLEIIFGVPDYRYKVYLLRFAMALVLVMFMLVLMSAFAWFSIVKIPVLKLVIQILNPIIFIACLTFMFTTLVRNGNGAAVIMVIIGLIFFIMNEPLASSKWNLFLNPYNVPTEMNISVWMTIVHQNRLILAIGSIIALLWGLMNLQYREKFM